MNGSFWRQLCTEFESTSDTASVLEKGEKKVIGVALSALLGLPGISEDSSWADFQHWRTSRKAMSATGCVVWCQEWHNFLENQTGDCGAGWFFKLLFGGIFGLMRLAFLSPK